MFEKALAKVNKRPLEAKTELTQALVNFVEKCREAAEYCGETSRFKEQLDDLSAKIKKEPDSAGLQAMMANLYRLQNQLLKSLSASKASEAKSLADMIIGNYSKIGEKRTEFEKADTYLTVSKLDKIITSKDTSRNELRKTKEFIKSLDEAIIPKELEKRIDQTALKLKKLELEFNSLKRMSSSRLAIPELDFAKITIERSIPNFVQKHLETAMTTDQLNKGKIDKKERDISIEKFLDEVDTYLSVAQTTLAQARDKAITKSPQSKSPSASPLSTPRSDSQISLESYSEVKPITRPRR